MAGAILTVTPPRSQALSRGRRGRSPSTRLGGGTWQKGPRSKLTCPSRAWRPFCGGRGSSPRARDPSEAVPQGGGSCHHGNAVAASLRGLKCPL